VGRRGLVLFVAMCVIWGIPYLLIKVELRGFGPVDLVFVRFALGAVLLVPIALSRRVKVGPPVRALELDRRLHDHDLPALGVIASSLLLAAVAYAPAALIQLPHAWPSGQSIAAVLALGVVCTALAFLIFFALIREIGPVRATVITYVNPAVAVTLGVLLLHERLTAGIVVGFVLILCGSVLAARAAPPRAGGVS
jgi:drug/metabolite transporter (DMT)-like permease